jgi:signal transduction histidine kinase
MEIISLSVILDPVLDLYREPIEHNELNLVGKESWDVVICADRAMIRTLLRNLLSNAIQYTPKGGKIRFSSQAVEDGKIRLGVANSGEAIPQEVMDGLMREESDPDATGRRGRDASEIASGLGLLLCREVVRAHAGVMTFRQIEGFGPLIEFELATETIAE